MRIVASTKTDLKKLVDEGRFRSDFFYRLNVVQLAVPPLRERLEDIEATHPPLLFQGFDDLQLAV